MAVALERRICNLFPEFPADALILFRPLQTAGAITAGSFQAVLYHLHHFFVFIQAYCHRGHSPFLFSIACLSIAQIIISFPERKEKSSALPTTHWKRARNRAQPVLQVPVCATPWLLRQTHADRFPPCSQEGHNKCRVLFPRLTSMHSEYGTVLPSAVTLLYVFCPVD